MDQGESYSVDISMPKDFNTYFSCGTYSISVLYEGKVSANNRFSAVLDYKKTVPTLIDLVGGSDEWTRMWARNKLFSIVGQPTWKPSRVDTKERIRKHSSSTIQSFLPPAASLGRRKSLRNAALFYFLNRTIDFLLCTCFMCF
jgi:hypothetical protein